ncbi:Polynucleotide 5'-hydroxyl-kinase nol9 [Globisporangium polare]
MATSTGMSRRNSTATGAAATADGREFRYRASCLRSGDVVVLGMRVDAAINCAGMALFRVFQGHVEVLGFQPALGTYYSLYSPKWSSLMVIEGRTNANTRSEATKQLLDAAYQAPFRDANKKLLALTEPSVAAASSSAQHAIEMDDEHAADTLAQEMAEDFPVVLVFRAIPVTYGNVMCFFESNRSSEKDANPSTTTVVLPGFKMIIGKEDQGELEAATQDSGDSVTPANPTELQYHDWKNPGRVLLELTHVDSFRTIQITKHWKRTGDAIEASLLAPGGNPRQSIVVCGAKGVGKSTFCRYLVNRLLSHYGMVAFLDTDLGQSELTPPGLVSLHALVAPVLGPGFTHMKMPLRSFFCGGTNPGNDPLYYMQAVKSLLRLYEAKWGNGTSNGNKSVPLVINTDGWVKSMGHDLLCSVIEEANPDHVVQLLATTKNKQFTVPTDGKWRIHGVEPWDSSGVVQPPRSSKDMRLYRWHQYFLAQQSVLSGSGLARAQLQNVHVLSEKIRLDDQISRAYAGVTPFAVSFDSVDIGFVGTSVAPTQLLYSLNGSIVGLCISTKRPPLVGEPLEAPEGGYRAVNGPPRILLKPAHAPCLGVGLIRAVDVVQRLFFIVSPLPLGVVSRVNLLVRGNFPLASLVVDVVDPVQAPYVVTDVLASEGTGAAAMQSRNNLKRKRDDKPNGGK